MMADLARAEQPTLFFASPGFVAGLLDSDAPDDTFSSVRATVTAGEALPGDLQKRFTERFGKSVLDGIGTTEALHIFISNTLDDQRGGSSGTVVPGYDVRLLDDSGADVAEAGVPGYLHVRGPSIATGYWRRDDATAAASRDGWLRTGDVYTRSADDHWTFLGRNSDMIKAGGIWVSPAEVESALVSHPDVLEAAVVGGRTADGLEEVVAFVVPRAGRTVDAQSVDEHCRACMAAFKRPRRLLVVAELPKTATGKPVAGYVARVVDDAMNEVPRGEIGRLAVRGPTGCRYLADKRQTNYVRDGWNITGDTFKQDADGYFHFVARADDMIISAGYNIAGPEVEAALLSHADVAECAVIGHRDAERGEIVAAYVVLKPNVEADDLCRKKLQDHVKAVIAPYKYPRALHFVAALPKTQTGKIQRFKLREQT
jgi:acyl-coenzyme A synthetase/AMP-(fatty) acid ligase